MYIYSKKHLLYIFLESLAIFTMQSSLLVSLFNGTSTFVVYLMPKLSLQNSSDTIQPIAGEDKVVHTVLKRELIQKRTWLRDSS